MLNSDLRSAATKSQSEQRLLFRKLLLYSITCNSQLSENLFITIQYYCFISWSTEATLKATSTHENKHINTVQSTSCFWLMKSCASLCIGICQFHI